MHDQPIAFVSHKTATRLRLKVPSRRKDKEFFSTLAERMSALEGVKNVEINPLTGSILLSHASDPGKIVGLAMKNGLLSVESPRSVPTHLHRRVSGVFDGADAALRDATGNELDIGGTAFLILLALGGYQIIQGNFTAIPWYGAGWYALNIFLKSNTGKQSAP